MSHLVRAGIAERVAMQMTGHKTRNIVKRYNIVNKGDLFEAAAKLEAFTAQSTDKVRRFKKGTACKAD